MDIISRIQSDLTELLKLVLADDEVRQYAIESALQTVADHRSEERHLWSVQEIFSAEQLMIDASSSTISVNQMMRSGQDPHVDIGCGVSVQSIDRHEAGVYADVENVSIPQHLLKRIAEGSFV